MQFFLAQAEEESSGGLIDVVPGLMIWTLICFGITFYVLKRFAFARIQAGIDERRERIRKAIEEADRAREEARALLEEHRQMMGAGEGRRRRDPRRGPPRGGRAAGAGQRRGRGGAPAQARGDEAPDRGGDEALARPDPRRGRELALEATARITGKVLDAEDQRRLIDEAIAELDFSVIETETV